MGDKLKAFSNLLFFSGAFNIALAAPLMIPGFTARYFAFLWALNEGVHLGGARPVAPLEGVNGLLVNTAGIDLVLIGVIVIYAGFSPATRLFIPLVNAIGRTVFACVVIYYVVAFDVARIVLVLGVIDLAISAGFFYYIVKIRRDLRP